MKTSTSIRLSQSLGMALFATLFATACATDAPTELKNARIAYARASAGPAAQRTPTDLHNAKVALDQAEENFAKDESSQKTKDLAYIAERTAQIAEARAAGAAAEEKTEQAKQEFGDKQGQIATATQGALVKTRQALADQAHLTDAERVARQSADEKAAASEQKAAASEAKAKEANDALAKLAAKEEERGMVITLSGSVLFRSNDATLLPAATARLDEVAAALVAKGHDVVIEGYTDSKGTASSNVGLSQRRADSVRSYVISRGFPPEKISAHGMGSDRPIAENSSAEGRANNRRVEIVIAKNSPGSN